MSWWWRRADAAQFAPTHAFAAWCADRSQLLLRRRARLRSAWPDPSKPAGRADKAPAAGEAGHAHTAALALPLLPTVHSTRQWIRACVGSVASTTRSHPPIPGSCPPPPTTHSSGDVLALTVRPTAHGCVTAVQVAPLPKQGGLDADIPIPRPIPPGDEHLVVQVPRPPEPPRSVVCLELQTVARRCLKPRRGAQGPNRPGSPPKPPSWSRAGGVRRQVVHAGPLTPALTLSPAIGTWELSWLCQACAVAASMRPLLWVVLMLVLVVVVCRRPSARPRWCSGRPPPRTTTPDVR